MTQLSQRDPRWSQIKLGYSTTATIGTDGCFITVIAMILGTTPDVVNERLKAVGGFLPNSGNLIWNKLLEAFPGITIEHLLAPYNNDIVKTNIPAFVTVNGAPIGAPLHAVLYIGNQQMIDPWTGKTESTSKYTPLKFVIIKGKWVYESQEVKIERLQKQIIDLKATKERLEKTIADKDQAITAINKDWETKLAKQTKDCQTVIDIQRQRIKDAIGKLQEI